jgi:hypothetical protein
MHKSALMEALTSLRSLRTLKFNRMFKVAWCEANLSSFFEYLRWNHSIVFASIHFFWAGYVLSVMEASVLGSALRSMPQLTKLGISGQGWRVFFWFFHLGIWAKCIFAQSLSSIHAVIIYVRSLLSENESYIYFPSPLLAVFCLIVLCVHCRFVIKDGWSLLSS